MARSGLTRPQRRRQYLEASLRAGMTGLPAEQREAYEAQLRSHERAYPDVRRHALAGTRRHFDEPLSAGAREHQAELRRRENMDQGSILHTQRELDQTQRGGRRTPSSSGARRGGTRTRRAAGATAAATTGALADLTPGGGGGLLYLVGLMLALSLLYLLVAGKGATALTGIVTTVVNGVRAFVAPVDPISALERSFAAEPLHSSGAEPRHSSGATASHIGKVGITPSGQEHAAPHAGSGYIGALFPGAKFTPSRTDAGKDFASITGNIGAIAPGTIVAERQYRGFGTTIFEKLATPIAGRDYVYYALETGGRAGALPRRVSAGTPLAQGIPAGSIEVGLASSPDVTGIHQLGEGIATREGEAFAAALGL